VKCKKYGVETGFVEVHDAATRQT